MHFLNAMLTDPEIACVAVAADISNAFNNRERAEMLAALYQHESLKGLWRLADWAYTDKSPLWLRDSDGRVSSHLISSNGVRQGCGLGAVLFAISMKAIYEEVQKLVPGIRAIAIMDDFYMVGKPAEVLEAYEHFDRLCKLDGSLFLNRSKGKYISFQKEQMEPKLSSKVEALELKVYNKAVKVLGAPIGIDDAEVDRLLTEKVNEYFALFERIQHKKMTEVTADQILRTCGVPSISYLLRCVAPARTRKVAQLFDAWVLGAYKTKHGIGDHELTPDKLLQLTLPLRSSGLGLTNHMDTAWFAFWGAAARAAGYFGVQGLLFSPHSQYREHVLDCFDAIAGR